MLALVACQARTHARVVLALSTRHRMHVLTAPLPACCGLSWNRLADVRKVSCMGSHSVQCVCQRSSPMQQKKPATATASSGMPCHTKGIRLSLRHLGACNCVLCCCSGYATHGSSLGGQFLSCCNAHHCCLSMLLPLPVLSLVFACFLIHPPMLHCLSGCWYNPAVIADRDANSLTLRIEVSLCVLVSSASNQRTNCHMYCMCSECCYSPDPMIAMQASHVQVFGMAGQSPT